jgi:hypothetical protein
MIDKVLAQDQVFFIIAIKHSRRGILPFARDATPRPATPTEPACATPTSDPAARPPPSARSSAPQASRPPRAESVARHRFREGPGGVQPPGLRLFRAVGRKEISMTPLIVKSRKPRNPLVAATRFRRAGKHGGQAGAERRAGRKALQGELKSLARAKPPSV